MIKKLLFIFIGFTLQAQVSTKPLPILAVPQFLTPPNFAFVDTNNGNLWGVTATTSINWPTSQITGFESSVRGSISVTGSGMSYNSSTGVISSSISGATFLANTNVSQTAVIALLGGVRKVTITGIIGVLAGDRVMLTPVGSTPLGYALADVVATAANTIEVSFTAPALTLGSSFSIPCKVTVFR